MLQKDLELWFPSPALKLLSLHLHHCDPCALSWSFSIKSRKEDAIFKISPHIHILCTPQTVLKIQISVCPALPTPLLPRATALPLWPEQITRMENPVELSYQLPLEGKRRVYLHSWCFPAYCAALKTPVF